MRMILLHAGVAEAAAEDREVGREHRHGATIDLAHDRHEPVRGGGLGVDVGHVGRDERADLQGRALVEQQLDALARGQLAQAVLALDRGGPGVVIQLLVAARDVLDSRAHVILLDGWILRMLWLQGAHSLARLLACAEQARGSAVGDSSEPSQRWRKLHVRVRGWRGGDPPRCIISGHGRSERGGCQVITGEQYRESIVDGRKTYIEGRRIEDLASDPTTRGGRRGGRARLRRRVRARRGQP